MIYVASILSFIMGGVCGIVIMSICFIGRKENDENE